MCYTITDEFKKHVNVTRMDWELYKKIIDEIGGKVTALRLSLRGEATLHTKFIEAIKYAKDHGIKEVSTLTHGGKLTLPYFRKMVDAGIDWITVSADGVGETYERVRKPLKFNDLLDKLKAIKKYKEEHKLKRPVIKVQGIWPGIVESGPDVYYDTFKTCTDLVAFNPLIDYLSNDTHIEYLEEFTCPQQYQRLVIGADGLVMKCSNDEENREVIGDIKQKPCIRCGTATRCRQCGTCTCSRVASCKARSAANAICRGEHEDETAQVGERTSSCAIMCTVFS